MNDNRAHLVSWAQVLLLAGAYLAGIGVLFGNMQSGKDELSRSVSALSSEVRDMGISVNRLALATERQDEHMRSVDRRLEILEKDRTIENWKR